MGGFLLPLIMGGAAMASNSINNAYNSRLNQQNNLLSKELLELQYGYNEQAAANADERTRQLYNDLQSPQAITQQLKDAGLSIGMMYGNGGMGGQLQQGAQANNASPNLRNTIPMQTILDAQTANLMADAELKASQTRKNNSEADENESKIPVNKQQVINMQKQVEEMDTNINKMIQETAKMADEQLNIRADTDLKNNQAELTKAQKEYTNAQKEYTEAQTAIANIDLQYEGQIKQAQIKELEAKAGEAWAAAKKFNAETEQIRKLMDLQYDKLVLEIGIKGKEYLNWDEQKAKEWAEMTSRTNLNNAEWRKKQFGNDYYSAINRKFGEGCGDFLYVLHNDVLKLFKL